MCCQLNQCENGRSEFYKLVIIYAKCLCAIFCFAFFLIGTFLLFILFPKSKHSKTKARIEYI